MDCNSDCRICDGKCMYDGICHEYEKYAWCQHMDMMDEYCNVCNTQMIDKCVHYNDRECLI